MGRFSWKVAAAGIPLFVFYLLLSWIAATLVLMVWPGARDVHFFRAPAAPWWLMLLLLVISAVFEEVIVAAYAITALSRKGAGVAILASTLLRFAYHLYQGPLVALSIIPVGLFFGALFWRSRNVWPMIVGHVIADAVAFAVSQPS